MGDAPPPHLPPPSPARLISVLTAGVLAVSASAILIRWTRAPSLSVAFWRVTFSLLLLAPLWLAPPRRLALAALGPRQRRLLIGAGLCLGVHFWSWIASLNHTSVAASVLLVTTNPIWVGLLGPWVTGERPGRRVWIGVGVALLGAALIASAEPATQAAPRPLLGNSLALLGALAASGYLMLGRLARPSLDLWTYTSATLAIAWLVLLTAALLTRAPLTAFSPRQWTLLLSMALLPQLVGHGAMSWALAHLRADLIALVLLLEPVGASLLAAALLDEHPGPPALAGGALLLCAVAWVARAERRARPDP